MAFAAEVNPAGRFFVHRLLDCAHSFPNLDAPLLITDQAVLDIQLWSSFAAN